MRLPERSNPAPIVVGAPLDQRRFGSLQLELIGPCVFFPLTCCFFLFGFQVHTGQNLKSKTTNEERLWVNLMLLQDEDGGW